jgi:hypothetical protein
MFQAAANAVTPAKNVIPYPILREIVAVPYQVSNRALVGNLVKLSEKLTRFDFQL